MFEDLGLIARWKLNRNTLARYATASHIASTRPAGRSVERSVSRCGAVRCAQVRADGEEGLPRPALSQLEPRVHSRTLHIPVHQEPRRRRHHHVRYPMSCTLVNTFTSIEQYCAVVCSVRQRLLVYSTNCANRVQYRSVPCVHIHNPFEQFVAVLYKSISIRSHPSHECAESSRSSRCSWRRCATTSIIAVRCPLLPISLARPGRPGHYCTVIVRASTTSTRRTTRRHEQLVPAGVRIAARFALQLRRLSA